MVIGVVMIHDNEFLGPQHLAELGAIFDKTWSSFRSSSISERDTEERAQLACIMLRLFGLRQLGPDQLTKTALRLMTQSSPEVVSTGISAMASAGGRLVGCTPSSYSIELGGT